METENAAAAAAAAFTASSQLKEAVLGREPAFWQWRRQVASEVVLPEDCLPFSKGTKVPEALLGLLSRSGPEAPWRPWLQGPQLWCWPVASRESSLCGPKAWLV